MKDLVAIIEKIDGRKLNSLKGRYAIMSVFALLTSATKESKDECYEFMKSLIIDLKNKESTTMDDVLARTISDGLLYNFLKMRAVINMLPQQPITKRAEADVQDAIKFLKTDPPKETIPTIVMPHIKEFIAFQLHINPNMKEDLKDILAVAYALEDRMVNTHTKDDSRRILRACVEAEEFMFKDVPDSVRKLDGFKELEEKMKQSRDMFNKHGESHEHWEEEEKSMVEIGEAFLKFIIKNKQLDSIGEGLEKQIQGALDIIKNRVDER